MPALAIRSRRFSEGHDAGHPDLVIDLNVSNGLGYMWNPTSALEGRPPEVIGRR